MGLQVGLVGFGFGLCFSVCVSAVVLIACGFCVFVVLIVFVDVGWFGMVGYVVWLLVVVELPS